MTMLTDDRARAVAAPAPYFYFQMAVACAAVAFVGFAPTYWVPLTSGSFSATSVVTFTDCYSSFGHCSLFSRPGLPPRGRSSVIATSE